MALVPYVRASVFVTSGYATFTTVPAPGYVYVALASEPAMASESMSTAAMVRRRESFRPILILKLTGSAGPEGRKLSPHSGLSKSVSLS